MKHKRQSIKGDEKQEEEAGWCVCVRTCGFGRLSRECLAPPWDSSFLDQPLTLLSHSLSRHVTGLGRSSSTCRHV